MSAAEDALSPTIRMMSPADLVEVAGIEIAAYEYPWSAGIFRDCLLAGYTCLVMDGESGVVAYAIMSVAAAEAHVLNICVHPDAQGRGLGRRMMHALIACADETGAERMLLEVRPSNAAARSLYTSLGFVEIGLRPRYYQATQGREDAVVLCADMNRLTRQGLRSD